jgi:hypothetical protein
LVKISHPVDMTQELGEKLSAKLFL